MQPDTSWVNPDPFIADTVRWLERAVIGLNLCPFAKAPHVKGRIHHAVSVAGSVPELNHELQRELLDLQSLPAVERETTLLIVPHWLHDFLDFNDYLGQAQRLLKSLKLEGEFQIASFHPQYQFAGTDVDDITNFTNRSPYPTLHLLRESSIDQAVAAFPQAEAIFEANMRTLTELGRAGWDQLQVHPRS
jgi:hypothetical protein